MTTTTYGFNTPTVGTEEGTWGALINSNWDDVDDLLDGTTPIVCARLTTATLGSTALSPDTGNIQSYTMTSNTTFTDSLADGDQILFILSGGDSYTATWPTMEWVGSNGNAPTLGAKDVISMFKVGSTLHGVHVGTSQ